MNEAEYLTTLKVLRDLLKSGASLAGGLHELSQSKHLSPKLREVFKTLASYLSEGRSLDEALRALKGIPPTFIAIATAGNYSGRLVELLDEEISEVENFLKIRREFIATLLYPSIQVILLSCGLVGLWMLVRFVAESIIQSGIPASKLGFIGLTYQLPLWIPLIIAITLILSWFLGVLALYKSLSLLRINPIGPLRRLAIGRELRTLGLMIAAGLSWREALNLLNRHHSVLPANLENPSQLAEIIKDPNYQALLETSAQTGELDKTLISIGDAYITEGLNKLKSTVRLISIVILVTTILGLGLIVGYIAVSFLTSLFNIPASF